MAFLVNDTYAFLILLDFYTNFWGFPDDFRVFQVKTSTSYYVFEVESGASWLRTYLGIFPKRFPHYRLKYWLVHSFR